MKNLFLILFLVISSQLCAQVLNIDGGASLVAEKDVSIVLTGAGMRNDGVFIPDSSTVYMDGATFTGLTGLQPTDFFNLRFRGTGTKTNEGTANVLNGLGVEGTTTLDADGSANNRELTLKSSKTATAFVDKIVGGDVVGNVTVERYINSGIAADEHGKSWQFLATPTTGQTIFESWQEAGATPAGYGTRISGNGLGFDVYSATPALKYYNPATNNWTAVTNTSDPLQRAHGYMLFVRGDRTVINYNDPSNNTNMRSKGVLFRPTNPPVSVAVGSNQLQSFGNPYASRIDFREVHSISTGVYDMFYAWDPMLNGSYGLGGWQTLSAITGFIPTAGDATVYYPAGVPAPYIESGQTVLVFAGVGGGTVNFNEDVKTGGSALVHRNAITSDSVPAQKSMFISRLLYENKMADGNILVFQSGLSNSINEYDAPKLHNGGENLALFRDGTTLAVEAREPVTVTDTLFYYFSNVRQHEYILEWHPVNMPSDVTAYFVDQYLQTTTSVSLVDSTKIALHFTADAASRAADRFYIVFKLNQEKPFRFIATNAWANNNGFNTVWFKVNHEGGVELYEIEKSTDGRRFRNSRNIIAGGSTGVTSYEHQDVNPGRNTTYYRVRAQFANGESVYSDVMEVRHLPPVNFAAYPNPVAKGSSIALQWNNLPEGNYVLNITNLNGQHVFQTTMNITGKAQEQIINPAFTSSGSYLLKLTGKNGFEVSTTIVAQ